MPTGELARLTDLIKVLSLQVRIRPVSSYDSGGQLWGICGLEHLNSCEWVAVVAAAADPNTLELKYDLCEGPS